MNISLAAVNLNQDGWRNVNLALAEGRIGQGRFIKKFEEEFARILQVEYAVFVANGTLADQIAIAAVTPKEGGEVIVPALTFVAQPQAVKAAGCTPVFVDVDERGVIDPDLIEAAITDKTVAIMPTHLMGRAVDMTKVMEIAKRHNLPVVEDCCEALGTIWQGKVVGTYGVGTYSFYASHHITTGEGGMVTCSDKETYERLIRLRQFGRKSEDYKDTFIFDDPRGTNAKGTNLSAAVGLSVVGTAQMVREVRRKNAGLLNKALHESLEDVWFDDVEGEIISPHGYPIKCKNEKARNRALKALDKAGIEARRFMADMTDATQCPAFGGESTAPVANDFSKNWLFAPCHEYLKPEELEYLATHLKKHAS